MSPAPRLGGVGVVITRPLHAAEAAAGPLAREGARVIVFPALAIEEIAPGAALEALLSDLSRFDIAIFVSAGFTSHSSPVHACQLRWGASNDSISTFD